jgi:ABC-type transport system involved in cytochrome c biogenesis permease subunit
MDFSRLHRSEAIGAVAAVVLAVAVFLPWFSLDSGANVVRSTTDSAVWACGIGDLKCTGFETFPFDRWLILAACSAPLILAWIIVRGHTLSWPPGELTAVVGFTAVVLIGYNRIVSKQGVRPVGVHISFGYVIALLAAITIAFCGAWRATERPSERKAPGTI